jgi:NAD(P)H-hydrate repair Nnr-like enzyme with NAD(P)H-hydrate dehydratase domain
LEAAVLATYLGGLAAELIAEEKDLRGMTALDVIEWIPYAMKDLAR